MLTSHFGPGSTFGLEVAYESYRDFVLHAFAVRLPGHVMPQHPGRPRLPILLPQTAALKPHHALVATLLDRLTHHADITLLEGQSYRVRESEMEIAARRQKS